MTEKGAHEEVQTEAGKSKTETAINKVLEAMKNGADPAEVEKLLKEAVGEVGEVWKNEDDMVECTFKVPRDVYDSLIKITPMLRVVVNEGEISKEIVYGHTIVAGVNAMQEIYAKIVMTASVPKMLEAIMEKRNQSGWCPFTGNPFEGTLFNDLMYKDEVEEVPADQEDRAAGEPGEEEKQAFTASRAQDHEINAYE